MTLQLSWSSPCKHSLLLILKKNYHGWIDPKIFTELLRRIINRWQVEASTTLHVWPVVRSTRSSLTSNPTSTTTLNPIYFDNYFESYLLWQLLRILLRQLLQILLRRLLWILSTSNPILALLNLTYDTTNPSPHLTGANKELCLGCRELSLVYFTWV